jgi:hypothetical protein
LWLVWQKSSGTSVNRVRLYYSDDFGQNITLSVDHNIGGTNTYASQFNGAVSCHATDSNRVAAVVQRSTSGRVIVTTNGGANWASYSAFGHGNGYGLAWSGNRLVGITDVGASARIYRSDNDGVNWTNVGFAQSGSNKSRYVHVVRTEQAGLLFAFAYDPGSTHYLLRSTDNGDSWLQIGSFGGGTDARGLVYDVESGRLYYGASGGAVRSLPSAAERDWQAVITSDWVSLPSIGGGLPMRALALDE